MHRLFDAFREAGFELFLVGGAVRELARGIAMELIDDLDFCTNARPQTTLKILQDGGFTTYDVGIEFGTVGAVLRGPEERGYPKDCQITTYRSAEYYRRGRRHPEVRFGDTIDQDLRRRDFSINSIAMDANGQYIDPYDGLGDLRRGVLRVVADPWETLAEDPLRILRVGRFMSKLGFEAEASLRQAATDKAAHIEDISHERWLMEMTKLLCGAHPTQGLEFLKDVGILQIILPELAEIADDARAWAQVLAAVEAAPQEPIIGWTALTLPLDGEGFKAVAARYRMDNATAHAVQHALDRQGQVQAFRPEWSDPDVRRLVRRVDPHVELCAQVDRVRVQIDDALSEEARAERLGWIDAFLARQAALDADGVLRPELPSGVGGALMEAFALRPGPVVGQLKSHLEELILDGVLDSRRASDYYVRHLQENPPPFMH